MAASTTRAEKQQQQGDSRQAVAPPWFDAMHGALASEAHAVARDFGVDMLTVTFHPDHAAGRADDVPHVVVHEFLGVAPAERALRLVAADVSAMGPGELAVHTARLQALRTTLIRQMQGTTMEKKQGVDDGGVVSSRPSERCQGCPAPPPGKIRSPSLINPSDSVYL
jgi:hypothetical protein